MAWLGNGERPGTGQEPQRESENLERNLGAQRVRRIDRADQGTYGENLDMAWVGGPAGGRAAPLVAGYLMGGRLSGAQVDTPAPTMTNPPTSARTTLSSPVAGS